MGMATMSFYPELRADAEVAKEDSPTTYNTKMELDKPLDDEVAELIKNTGKICHHVFKVVIRTMLPQVTEQYQILVEDWKRTEKDPKRRRHSKKCWK